MANGPIFVTEAGMVMEVMAVCKKANRPMLCTELPSVTEVSWDASRKA